MRYTICLLLCAASLSARADDVVTYLGRDGKQLKRTGTIDDFTGQGLKITLASGRQEVIEPEKIVAIKTTATAEESAGDALVEQDKLDPAIEAYQKAKRTETRRWVVRRIMARLVDCYERQGKIDQAGDEFLAIASADPETPHFPALPLAWRAPLAEPTKAAAWLASKEPAAQLLGASWLLAGTKRQEAIAALKSLGGDLDPHVAHLAAAQLWRTTLVTANSAEVARWRQQLERIPAKLRGGPGLIVGDALARHGQTEDALLAYLQTPLVYNQRRVLAEEGYQSAARLLEKQGRADDAARVLRSAKR